MQAFEHLMYRELICFTDNRGHNLSVEFRPVKLLISSAELHQGLKGYRSSPVSSLTKLATSILFMCHIKK